MPVNYLQHRVVIGVFTPSGPNKVIGLYRSASELKANNFLKLKITMIILTLLSSCINNDLKENEYSLSKFQQLTNNKLCH